MVRKNLQCMQLRISITLCAALCVTLVTVGGCVRQMPSEAELARFDNAGPVAPSPVELNEFLRARVPVGPYRVVPGDLLGLEMPDVLRAIGDTLTEGATSIRRRVRNDGTVRLPGLESDLQVKGLTVAEIEELAEEAYAKEVLRRPAVVAYVVAHHRVYVTVTGLGIALPGQYELRSDELSLSALLMKAGGIAAGGADVITIQPADSEAEPLVLPVRDANVPLQDVALAGGERVEVTPAPTAAMTVVGQVGAPGRYVLDLSESTTLLDALAHARGVRETEDPRLVSVYRRESDGSVISARFRLNGNRGTSKISLFHDNELGDGAFARIKPGDVIVVERTIRSRARQVLANALNVSVGLSAAASTTYHEDLRDSGANRGDRVGGSTTVIYSNPMGP